MISTSSSSKIDRPSVKVDEVGFLTKGRGVGPRKFFIYNIYKYFTFNLLHLSQTWVDQLEFQLRQLRQDFTLGWSKFYVDEVEFGG